MTVTTVRMKRDESAANGGPLTADVHPDEVENYKLGGFVVDEAEKPTKAQKQPQSKPESE